MKDRPRGKGLWALTDRDLAAGRWVSTTSVVVPAGRWVSTTSDFHDFRHVRPAAGRWVSTTSDFSRSVGVHDFHARLPRPRLPTTSATTSAPAGRWVSTTSACLVPAGRWVSTTSHDFRQNFHVTGVVAARPRRRKTWSGGARSRVDRRAAADQAVPVRAGPCRACHRRRGGLRRSSACSFSLKWPGRAAYSRCWTSHSHRPRR